VVLRIFGGDAALHGVAVRAHVILQRHGHRLFVHVEALGNQNLAAHDVDLGHHFGDSVFHLDARVHFDEEELLRIEIHQELDGARADVADLATEPDRRVADRLPQFEWQIDAGGDLHHLLMTALHGAVSLPQVDEVAMMIAEDLHLDVLGMLDVAFNEHVTLAERRAGLALCFGQLRFQLAGTSDDTHAASTPAEAGLQD